MSGSLSNRALRRTLRFGCALACTALVLGLAGCGSGPRDVTLADGQRIHVLATEVGTQMSGGSIQRYVLVRYVTGLKSYEQNSLKSEVGALFTALRPEIERDYANLAIFEVDDPSHVLPAGTMNRYMVIKGKSKYWPAN